MTLPVETAPKPEVYEPKIIAFVCKWCTYAGADLAGMSRMQYSPNVKTLMLPCSGRIDITLVLRAFLQGADGVIVSGCHPGDCHYTAGNFRARRRWTLLRDLLDVLGFDLSRLEICWISAAEGGKWARTVQEFTTRIRERGPYTALRQVADDHAPDSIPHETGREHETPAPATAAAPDLLKAIREAFAAGQVETVLAWRRHRTLDRPAPGWITGADEAENLVNPGPAGNLVRQLRDPQVKNSGKLGIVARTAEVTTLNVLAQESQVDPEQVTVFEVDADGRFRGLRHLAEATSPLLDQLAAERVVGFSEKTLALVDDLMARTPQERFAFWTEQAQHCIRCYACRGSCPMCHCSTCYADKNQPQWFPTASDGPGNLAWLVVRAFHLAGRCIGCGACQEACPAGIPLNVLNATLARSALRNFGQRAGVDPTATPLQSDYKGQDPETFIV